MSRRLVSLFPLLRTFLVSIAFCTSFSLISQVTPVGKPAEIVDTESHSEFVQPTTTDNNDQPSNTNQSDFGISESDQSLRNAQLSRNLAVLMFLISLLVVVFLWVYAYTKIRVNQQLEKLHIELNVKNAELEALDRRKDHLIATVSHDLRNPLNGIIGVVDTLGFPDVIEDEKVRKELINLATVSARQAMHIVENLLNLEMIHSGELKLNLEKKQLQPIIQMAVMENKLITDSKAQKVMIDVELSARYVSILCEETALIQVLSNLISNASKYSPAESKIEISVELNGEEVLVSVTDQGPGINAEDLVSLYNPFSRGFSRATRGEKSIGYGLSIVKSLTEAMGGTVGVNSEIGCGSDFWIRFPIQKSEQVTPKTVAVKQLT